MGGSSSEHRDKRGTVLEVGLGETLRAFMSEQGAHSLNFKGRVFPDQEAELFCMTSAVFNTETQRILTVLCIAKVQYRS